MMNRLADKTDFRTKAGRCAKEIISWMLKHELWIDSEIYCDGKRFTCYDGNHYKYDNTWDCVFVEENKAPRDYFDYVGDFLSMSFEGPLYRVFNDWGNQKLVGQFNNIIQKYGKYYELGNAWNLSLFDN